MLPCALRLQRTLTEVQQMLDEDDGKMEQQQFIVDVKRRKELLRRVRRLGFLHRSLNRHLTVTADVPDASFTTLARSAELFLERFLSTCSPQCCIPVSCVGLMVCKQSAKQPFACSEPLMVHEEPFGVTVPASVLACPFHHDERSTQRDEKPSCGTSTSVTATRQQTAAECTANTTESVHDQVVLEIKEAIRGMREGATRMSDLMQQERQRLDTSAALLQHGVDGATGQCRGMDKVAVAFGGGPSLPSCLKGVPGCGMFWNTVVLPFWAVVRQAVLLFVIIAITGGVLLLMLTAPKTYAYAR